MFPVTFERMGITPPDSMNATEQNCVVEPQNLASKPTLPIA